ncbi:hypothetical protein Tco_1122277 [Tanacetum coccineum]|uniref:Membrane-associated protein n=1 Tax=Tanacetum coccineum TaxID=301880 RepID=A0ABQ5J037_9ASTR
MHHSMCSSTSSLVFMTLVLSLWAIPLVVPLVPTFIAINLLTCPRASLVVNSIVVCRSPTVTDQMAYYVAPVAFGRTWTIMMIVAFRTQWLGLAVIFLLPVPCSVSFASILPLVRLLLVLIVLGSVIQLPLVLSLAFGKSADLFVHTFLKLHYWTHILEVSQTSTLITGVSSLIPSSSRIPTLSGHVAIPLAIPALYSTLPIVVIFPLSLVVSILCYLVFFDSTFSGGGNGEGSAAANSVMHVSADGDCGKQTHQSQMPLYSQLEGTRSSVGTVEGSAGARCSSSSSSSSSFSTSSSLSSSDDYYHNCLIRWQDGQQDPPQGPPYPLPDRSRNVGLVIGL